MTTEELEFSDYGRLPELRTLHGRVCLFFACLVVECYAGFGVYLVAKAIFGL